MGDNAENPGNDIDSQIEGVRSRYASVRGYFDAHVKRGRQPLLFSNILSQPMSSVQTFLGLMDMQLPTRAEKFKEFIPEVSRELGECERLISILARDPIMETELWEMIMPSNADQPAESQPAEAYLIRLSVGLPLAWFLEYLEAYVRKGLVIPPSQVSKKVGDLLKEDT